MGDAMPPLDIANYYYELGNQYLSGGGNRRRDVSESERCFLKSVEHGNIDAKVALIHLYLGHQDYINKRSLALNYLVEVDSINGYYQLVDDYVLGFRCDSLSIDECVELSHLFQRAGMELRGMDVMRKSLYVHYEDLEAKTRIIEEIKTSSYTFDKNSSIYYSNRLDLLKDESKNE